MGVRGALVVAAIAVQTAGCLVNVERVADPGPAFAKARAQAERLSGQPGPAHELNVLVYDRDQRKLVRVSLPIWMVHELGGHDGLDFDSDVVRDNRAARRAARHLRLEDIERAGLGILAEVREEGGDRVLVWLS